MRNMSSALFALSMYKTLNGCTHMCNAGFIILFSLVEVQNQSFGPKQNTKLTVDTYISCGTSTHHPPTENFLKGSRLLMRPRFSM